MRKAALDRLLGLSVIGACFGCGASPVHEAKAPTVTVPANEVVVVPADRVVDKCPCDSDEQATPASPRKSVEYVHVTEWQSPGAAKRAEAFVAEDPSRFRSAHPVPVLSMHQGIPETRVHRLGHTRFGRY